MARKHLFRGFHPDENGTTIITDNGKKIKGNWVEGNSFIPDNPFTPTQICIGTSTNRICYDVIPYTVVEFIGITDKNGKKIFEDDFVTINTSNNYGNINGFTGLVVYYDCGFELMNIEDAKCFECIWYDESELEVIGNIFENHELLEDMQ